ncbi:Mariner transposable [Brachionus plicatilis]|uniref:Mariner transposable n=1 Tax=Brachionus plicatilis TaxID=10195 RepID=A0A3M7RRG1_BRAPC|nr:Mariner transposable [Brachionus plicatilis]
MLRKVEKQFVVQTLQGGGGSAEIWGCLSSKDGAPAHRAKLIKEEFGENNIAMLPWCARSPDLKPFKNFWSYIDAKFGETKLTSIEHLK